MKKNKKENKKKKFRFSLSFKINIFLTVIILLVSAELVNISYSTYKKTTYDQIYEMLDDAEENTKDAIESIKQYFPIAYIITHIDGYEEIRSEAEATDDPQILFDWCSHYVINTETGDYIRTEEYNKRQEDLKREAKRQGIKDDDVYQWMEQQDPELFSYYDIGYVIDNIQYSLGSIASSAEITNITVYIDENGGYEALGSGDILSRRTTIMHSTCLFGKWFEDVPAIDQYKNPRKNSKEKYPHVITEYDLYVSKVIPYEYDGQTYYYVYSYDVAKTLKGQMIFLLGIIITVFLMTIAAVSLSIAFMRHIVTKPLGLLTKAVKSFHLEIKEDEEATIIDLPIKSNDEIGELYDNIKSMETRIIEDSGHITKMTAEKERIGAELDLATRIQADMLPRNFPAFPDRTEFDIYASMNPAKEVGGDFYDFFLIDDDHLALVIADVSGKGVPAALFMMISKILVHNIAMEEKQSPAKILETANRQICANNFEEMFVTVWMGILELSTGKMTAANAGHEYPVIKKPDGGFELFKDKHGMVVGAMDIIKYKDYDLQLEPGTKLFVYTDGVPEATNSENELFGNDRMVEALNRIADGTPEEILRHVREEVDAFVGDAEQFDDLTMLCIEYKG